MIPRHQAERRSLPRKILLGLAILSYLAAVGSGAAAWWYQDQPQEIVGSLMASIVFFAGVGVVLHVLANASLPDLRVKR
ncbi:MAG TPA: hemerythrin family protein [Gammaproteobacteria bacterium]|nr:hemerythrin family protein [Gammaproteobacteria bacterium]